jgi:hypothetical protein
MALFILLLSLFVMPGPVRGAVAAGILPYSLSTKFSESHAVQVLVNEYHDGTSQRKSLVSEGRRTWNLSKHLTAAQLTQLRSFAASLQGGAFYFYNPQETLPPFSNNPIGTSGQYLVRFNGDWSQTNGMVRSDSEIQLIELTTQSEDIPVVTVGGSGGLPGSGGGGGGGTTPSGPPVAIDVFQLAGSFIGSVPNDYYRNYGPIYYGGQLWAFTLTENFDLADGLLGVYKSLTGATWIRQDLAHAPSANRYVIAPSYPYWDGVSSTITILVLQSDVTPPIPSFERTMSLVDFDMATGLFSSTYGEVDLGPPETATAFRHAYVFKLSNGTIRIVAEYGGSDQSQIYYQDYTAGAWGLPHIFPGQTVGSGSWYFLNSATQDGDVIHAVYMDIHAAGGPAGPNFNEAHYVQIAADGTFSTPVALSAILSPDGTTYFSINTGIISGDHIILPVRISFDAPANVGVLVGSPKSNPTFTYVAIASSTRFAEPVLFHRASEDVFAWTEVSSGTGNISQVYISTSTDNGATWTTPQLRLDIDVHPLPGGAGEDTTDINSISLGTDRDGSIGLMLTTWTGYYIPPTWPPH